MTYVFDNAKEKEEFDRLQLIERELDPDTFRRLRSVPIRPDWKILEVGPGAGSVLDWLGAQVKNGGHLTAIDINPRFVIRTESNHIKVVKADFAEFQFKEEKFDLVHGRYIFMHIKDYERALGNVFQVLKPGGWLVVEEPDFEMSKAACQNEKDRLAFDKVNSAVQAMYGSMGTHYSLGRFLPEILQKMGFRKIQTETTVHLARGGTGMTEMMKRSISHLADRLIATGKASDADVNIYLHLCDDANSWNQYYSTVATIAQK